MKNRFLEKLTKIYRDKKKRKKIKRTFFTLAAIVVFITSYILILPAITVEKDKAEENNIPINETETDTVLEDTNTEEIYQDPIIEENMDEDLEDSIELNEVQDENNVDDESNVNNQIRRTIEFVNYDRGFKVIAKVENSNLPDDAVLKITPIEAKQTDNEDSRLKSFENSQPIEAVSRFSEEEGQNQDIPQNIIEDEESLLDDQDETEDIESLDQKTKEIEEKIEDPIEEILFYDISFFTPEGEYLPVDDKATISFNISEENLSKSEDEEITVAHFGKEEMTLLEPKVEVDEDEKVEEISFETDGFSVFAVIKHSTWTEARIPTGIYTIITKTLNDEYKTFGSIIEDKKLSSKVFNKAEVNDLSVLNKGPIFNFNDGVNRSKYDKYRILKKSGNIYTIQEIKTSKYLAITNNGVNYQKDEFYFKFYVKSTEPNKIVIKSASTQDKKTDILAYNKDTQKFEVKDNYNDESEYVSFHQLVSNPISYRILSHNEIRDLKDGKYIVVSANNDGENNRRSLYNQYYDDNYLDSTSLRQEGNKLYVQEDPNRNGNYRLPEEWEFIRNGSGFNIKDSNGSYLKIGSRNSQKLELVPNVSDEDLKNKPFLLQLENTNKANVVQILTDDNRNQKWGVNLRDNQDTWQTWSEFKDDDAQYNGVYIAVEDIISDKVEPEEDLVEAIIPDGDYFISNEISDYGLSNDRSDSYLNAYQTVDQNNILKQRNGNRLENNYIFHIERKSDGTYRVTHGNRPKDFLQITNLIYDSYDYKRIYLTSGTKQANSEKIKIATTDKNPDLFYIYNNFGSLQIYPWKSNTQFAASKVGSLGTPLRLYRVTNKNPVENKRFTHQENTPTEKLANIPDGNYVIGNNPNINNDSNKQSLNTLQNNFDIGQGWIHYNEKAENDNKEYHTIEEKDENKPLEEWSFIQTDEPGHYYIKNKSGSYLSLGSGNLTIGNNPEKVSIYKDEEKVDQVLITQGNYRLRFDKTWQVVKNSEPLTDADYHYIGKKITGYLNFKLTNPDGTIIDTEDTSTNPDEVNKWDNNVRLMEKVLVNNLNGSLATNIPKGYFEEESEIAKIFKEQYPDQVNPYTNLYRVSQSKENLPANVKESDLNDHYKEYALIGWEFQKEENIIYLIDKDAEFTKKEGIGIEISSDKVMVNGNQATENLIIPYGNENPLKTKWREVSAPLYFNFNYGKGIMDIERGISVEKALDREAYNLTTPVVAKGRLFFGEDLEISQKATTSVITADNKISGKFKTNLSLEFPDQINGNLDKKIHNQIVMSKITLVPPENLDSTNVTLEVKNLISSNLLKERSINWARESNTEVAILKKPKVDNENPDVDFEPDKENITTDNYKVDYLWLDRQDNGNYLKGIVYADTAELVVEKEFKKLEPREIEDLRQEHNTSYETYENFHIDMMVDNERKTGEGDRKYDDVLYTLAFNRTESGNTTASPYPKIGDKPVSYSAIERVNTEYDKEKGTVKWRVRVFDKEEYVLHEKGVNFNDERTLYSRIEEFNQGEDRPFELKRTLESDDITGLKNIKSNILKTGDNNYVRFNNLYTKGGVILLTKYDKDTSQVISGIPFVLYKLENGQKKQLYAEDTDENGTITFSGLGEGDYILKENLPDDSVYKPNSDIEFKIVGNKIEKEVYKPNDLVIKPSEEIDGKTTLNYIDVYNETKDGTLTIEKEFTDILYSEYQNVLKNFKVIVEGKKDGKTYEKILTYENIDSSTYTQKLFWKINQLEAKDGGVISISNLDEVSIREEGYEYSKYPVVKRKAWFNKEEKDFAEYPYKIQLKKGENAENYFKLQNIYTDKFELLIKVKGRDKEYNNYVNVKDMVFEIYGDADEANPNKPLTPISENINSYLLEKPTKEGGDPINKFETKEKGLTSILNLVYLEGTKYYLKQSYNPGDSENNEGVIYYPLEKPFEIYLDNIEGSLTPVVKDNLSVKGKMTSEYQGGILIIKLDLDRTNYRLPETGGVGTNMIKKVALGMIFAAVTLLIYKNKFKRSTVK